MIHGYDYRFALLDKGITIVTMLLHCRVSGKVVYLPGRPTGAYIDKSGVLLISVNEPRFSEKDGLLIEGQRTKILFLYETRSIVELFS